MSTTIREALPVTVVRRQDFMDKRLALLAIRLLVSVEPSLCCDLFSSCRGGKSVTLFTQMSHTVHGLVISAAISLGSGVFGR